MVTQQQRSDATRKSLLAAFRRAFLNVGYDKTSLQQVLVETGLSKGALYHHFASKQEIIAALYADESRLTIAAALASVDPDAKALDRLRAASLAWFDAVRDPEISKILFEIGPAALGPARAKAIEDENSLRLIQQALDSAIACGEIAAVNVKIYARFINALIAEAALYRLANASDVTDALEQSLDGVLEALKASR